MVVSFVSLSNAEDDSVVIVDGRSARLLKVNFHFIFYFTVYQTYVILTCPMFLTCCT